MFTIFYLYLVYVELSVYFFINDLILQLSLLSLKLVIIFYARESGVLVFALEILDKIAK